MFSEAMLEMDQELFGYKQNELEHYLFDNDRRNDYDNSGAFLFNFRTIGGVKL